MDCNQRFTGIENRLGRVENRLDNVENRLGNVEKRLDKVETSLDKLRDTVEGLRWWIVGSLLAGIAIVTAFAAYQATWVQKYVDKSEASNTAFIEEMDKRWQAINAEQQKRHDEMLKIISGRVDRLERKQE